ncbi:MAG: hypothetical protein ACLTAI_13980 [Thomasclavelia sp.]
MDWASNGEASRDSRLQLSK